MLDAHECICNSRECKNCTFPRCSHMTGKRYHYRCPDEIEMRLACMTNDNNYYMKNIKYSIFERRINEN